MAESSRDLWEPLTAMNDPKIAAVVGDYEEWPEFDIEKGCGPLLVGSEGC